MNNLSFNLAITLIALVLLTVFWRQLDARLGSGGSASRMPVRRRCATPPGAGFDHRLEPRRSIDLQHLFDELPRDCESLLRGAGIVLKPGAVARVPLHVLARVEELRQLLAHVMALACHAMPLGGVLHWRATAEDWHAVIEFTDAGHRHREPLLAALYEHGLRMPVRTTGMDGALAANVASCRRIVAAHDGRIGTAPSASGGPRLVIRLPLQRAAASKEKDRT